MQMSYDMVVSPPHKGEDKRRNRREGLEGVEGGREGGWWVGGRQKKSRMGGAVCFCF